jgi:hypothetical protein
VKYEASKKASRIEIQKAQDAYYAALDKQKQASLDYSDRFFAARDAEIKPLTDEFKASRDRVEAVLEDRY